MPYELSYQLPDDPPPPMASMDHFMAANSEYVPIFYCQIVQRELTTFYLARRKNGSSQEEAIQVL